MNENKMYTVYRVWTYDVKGNKYGINRDESWVTRVDKIFDSLEEAREYVIQGNRIHSDMVLYTHNAKDKEAAISEFCFGNKHLQHRRFFIGAPPAEVIRKSLRKDGVQVISN